MRRTVLLILFIVAANGIVVGVPQNDGIVALKTDAGVMVVWNQPRDSFTLELPGKEIQPLSDRRPVFFSVDGVVVQVGSVAVEEFLSNQEEKAARVILATHRDWEAKYLSDSFGKKVAVQSSEIELGPGGVGLAWSYDMPHGVNAEAKKQLYVTLVTGRHEVLLNGVVTARATEEHVRKLLIAIAMSVRSSHDRIDVEKLQKSIQESGS